MTPNDYATLVKAERAAHGRLMRLLRAWGDKSAVSGVRDAWNAWFVLAVKVEDARAGLL